MSTYRRHIYREKPLFTGRVWYRHPDYGPMIIDSDLLQMIQPVCQKIRDSGFDNELLSLPFPGANYFCFIPPWHGYNQGNPLQQRYLDQLIEQKIGKGTWRVVYTSDYGTRQQWGQLWDNQWILIETR